MSKVHTVEFADFENYTKVSILASGPDAKGRRKEISVALVVYPTPTVVYIVTDGLDVEKDYATLPRAIKTYNDL